THTPSNQKIWAPCQPWASDSVSSAEVNAYSDELMAIIAIHGSHTIDARDRPRMSRSVSPIRYTLPLSSITSRYFGCAGEFMLSNLLMPCDPATVFFGWCGNS